jgi:hypothetical protein
MKKLKHAIALLDLGAASVQTKGGTGRRIENVDCIIHGNIFCP